MPRYYIEQHDGGFLLRDFQQKSFRVWLLDENQALELLRRLNRGEEAARRLSERR